MEGPGDPPPPSGRPPYPAAARSASTLQPPRAHARAAPPAPARRARAQALWRAPLAPAGAPPPAVVALSHVPELDAIFIALASGQLLLLHAAGRQLEPVGAVEGGAAAAAWSPDGEAVAVAGARDGKLLLLSKVGARARRAARLLPHSTPFVRGGEGCRWRLMGAA
jgi:hypothetical protein